MNEKEILLEIMKQGNVLSQSILAEATGIKHQQISAWMNEKRTPKLSTLQEIAKAVGVNIVITVEKSNNHV